MKQSVEQTLKERSSRDYRTWGSIPYTVTKPRHYCGCQQAFDDRVLIQLSSEYPTNTEVGTPSQALNKARVPNGGARKWTKGAEGAAAPLEKLQYEPTSIPRAPRD